MILISYSSNGIQKQKAARCLFEKNREAQEEVGKRILSKE
jgi:hypothetical protein